MTISQVLERRLRSHRLSAPARTIAEAAEHMLATQGQEFWGGRWALAARTRGDPSVRDVDAAFDRGEIVRSWTMRGTIHVIPARDLAWVLGITSERQFRSAAQVHRIEAIDAAELAKAERLALQALGGGNRLTRKELFAVFEQGGVSTAHQRGYHLLVALSLRSVVCQGPVVPRESGPTREQYVVRIDEWVTEPVSPADPLAEMFFRFIASHAPAGARDFAWWSGLPLGLSRAAAEAASDRLAVVSDDGEPVYVTGRAGAPPHGRGSRGARSAAVRGVLHLVRRPHGGMRTRVPGADRAGHERHRAAAARSRAARSSASGPTRSPSTGTRIRRFPSCSRRAWPRMPRSAPPSTAIAPSSPPERSSGVPWHTVHVTSESTPAARRAAAGASW